MQSGSRLDVKNNDRAAFPTDIGQVVVKWRYDPRLDAYGLTIYKDEPVDPSRGRMTMTKHVSAEVWRKVPELPVKRLVEDFTKVYKRSGGVVPVEGDDIHWWQRMVALLAQKLCDERGVDRIMVGERDIREAYGLWAIVEETPEGVEITPQREGGPLSGEDRPGVGADELPLLIPGLWDGDGVRPDVRDGDEDDDGADESVQDALTRLRAATNEMERREWESQKMRQMAREWTQRSGDVKETYRW